MDALNNLNQEELQKPYTPDDMSALFKEVEKVSAQIKGFGVMDLVLGKAEVPNVDELTSALLVLVLKMGNSITFLQGDIAKLQAQLSKQEGAINGD